MGHTDGEGRSTSVTGSHSIEDADVIVTKASNLSNFGRSGRFARTDGGLRTVGDIDPRLLNGRWEDVPKFALPFAWDVTGIGFRRAKMYTAPDSWGDLYASQGFPGRSALSSDASELIGIGAKMLGRSSETVVYEVAVAVGALVAAQRRDASSAIVNDGSAAFVRRRSRSGPVRLWRVYSVGIVISILRCRGKVVESMRKSSSSDCPREDPRPHKGRSFCAENAAALAGQMGLQPAGTDAQALLKMTQAGNSFPATTLANLDASDYRQPISSPQADILKTAYGFALAQRRKLDLGN